MFDRLSREAEQIIENIIELVYFMRGSVGYEEMLRRTHGERQLIHQFLNRRLESEKKSPHPNY